MTSSNPPDRLPQTLSRVTIYESPWVNLHVDRVQLPTGHIIERYHLLDFPNPAVAILLEDGQGRVAFVRISRHTTRQASWEIPAGGVEPGETLLEAARRETLEETGFTLDGLEHIYTYHPMNGISNMVFHILRARAVEPVQSADPDEVSAVHWFSRDDVRQMIYNRSITDGFSLSAVLLWLIGADRG